MPDKFPETVIELCDYIEKHASGIYVREKDATGKFDAVALTELPVKLAIQHTLRFIREGRVPVVVFDEQPNGLPPPEAMHGAADDFGGSDYE